MKFALIGVTGTAGKEIAANLKEHEVIEVPRSNGVDLATGEGLEEALHGTDVCVDASMSMAPDDEVLTELLSGVGHLVFLSITNLVKPVVTKFPYYAAKAAQVKLMRETDLPTSVVNSAQRMEFVLNPASSSEEDDTIKVEDWLIQLIALADAARTVAHTALGDGSLLAPKGADILGPDVAAYCTGLKKRLGLGGG
ncbi:SDR family oxidoreductase [Corynebacterium striatum]